MTATYIALDNLRLGVFTPRMGFDQEWIEELAGDIRRHGQQKPIIVQHQPEPPYPVIDGEHRCRAMKRLEANKIRVEVRELSDEEAIFLAMHINELHGKHLNDFERGRQLCQLQDRFGWSQEKLGEMFGRSQQWVSDRIGLYRNAGKELTDNLYHGVVTFTHAREIVKLPKKQQPALLSKVVTERLSAKHARLLVNAFENANAEERMKILENPMQAIAELYPDPRVFAEAVKTSNDDVLVECFECPGCGRKFIIDWVEKKIE